MGMGEEFEGIYDLANSRSRGSPSRAQPHGKVIEHFGPEAKFGRGGRAGASGLSRVRSRRPIAMAI